MQISEGYRFFDKIKSDLKKIRVPRMMSHNSSFESNFVLTSLSDCLMQ